MALATNVLALVIVVGLCWVGMTLFAARVHGRHDDTDLFQEAARGDLGPGRPPAPPSHTPRPSMPATPPRAESAPIDRIEPADRGPDVPTGEARASVSVPRDVPCATCNGSGAQTQRGRLQPCSTCEGTGVN